MPRPAICGMVPDAGSQHGGTSITLFSMTFRAGDRVRVRFTVDAESRAVDAVCTRDHELRLQTPALGAAAHAERSRLARVEYAVGESEAWADCGKRFRYAPLPCIERVEPHAGVGGKPHTLTVHLACADIDSWLQPTAFMDGVSSAWLTTDLDPRVRLLPLLAAPGTGTVGPADSLPEREGLVPINESATLSRTETGVRLVATLPHLPAGRYFVQGALAGECMSTPDHSATYTVLRHPTLRAVAPPCATGGSAAQLALQGAGFEASATRYVVRLEPRVASHGTTPCIDVDASADSPTTLVFSLPAAAQPGEYDIRVLVGNDPAPLQQRVAFVVFPTPCLLKLCPASGPATGGTLLTMELGSWMDGIAHPWPAHLAPPPASASVTVRFLWPPPSSAPQRWGEEPGLLQQGDGACVGEVAGQLSATGTVTCRVPANSAFRRFSTCGVEAAQVTVTLDGTTFSPPGTFTYYEQPSIRALTHTRGVVTGRYWLGIALSHSAVAAERVSVRYSSDSRTETVDGMVDPKRAWETAAHTGPHKQPGDGNAGGHAPTDPTAVVWCLVPQWPLPRGVQAEHATVLVSFNGADFDEERRGRGVSVDGFSNCVEADDCLSYGCPERAGSVPHWRGRNPYIPPRFTFHLPTARPDAYSLRMDSGPVRPFSSSAGVSPRLASPASERPWAAVADVDAKVPVATLVTPIVRSVCPACGPRSGGTRITLHGENFRNDGPVGVIFGRGGGRAVLVPGRCEGAVVHAVTPQLPVAQQVAVLVSFGDGAEAMSESRARFVLYEPPSLRSVYPALAPLLPGVSLLLYLAQNPPAVADMSAVVRFTVSVPASSATPRERDAVTMPKSRRRRSGASPARPSLGSGIGDGGSNSLRLRRIDSMARRTLSVMSNSDDEEPPSPCVVATVRARVERDGVHCPLVVPSPASVPALQPHLPAAVAASQLEVELALDGQHFEPLGNLLAFAQFFVPPQVAKAHPSSIPSAGGTQLELTPRPGQMFIDTGMIRALFLYEDGTFAQASATYMGPQLVTCSAPPREVPLDLREEQHYEECRVHVLLAEHPEEHFPTWDTPGGAALQCYPVPMVEAVEPQCGPLHADIPVTIRGRHFVNTMGHVRVQFGSFLVRASLVSSSELRCTAPKPLSAGPLPVEVQCPGLPPACAPQPFLFYDLRTDGELALEGGLSGPTTGGAVVVVRGSSFPQTGTYIVRLIAADGVSTATAAAQLLDSRRLEARSPPLAVPGHATVQVSFDGTHFEDVRGQFDVHEAPTVTRVQPPSGLGLGGAKVRLIGSNLTPLPGCAPLVLFRSEAREALVRADVMGSGGELLCISPRFPAPTRARLSVARNGVHFVDVDAVFDYYEHSSAPHAADPCAGPVAGGTRIELSCPDMVDCGYVSVQFAVEGGTRLEVSGVAKNGQVTCTAPAWPDPERHGGVISVEVDVAAKGRSYSGAPCCFTFYQQIVPRGVLPTHVEHSAGERIVLLADGAVDVGSKPSVVFRCRDGSEYVVDATIENEGRIACDAPVLPEGVLEVSAALNGVSFAVNEDDAPLPRIMAFAPPVHLSVPRAPTTCSTVLELRGAEALCNLLRGVQSVHMRLLPELHAEPVFGRDYSRAHWPAQEAGEATSPRSLSDAADEASPTETRRRGRLDGRPLTLPATITSDGTAVQCTIPAAQSLRLPVNQLCQLRIQLLLTHVRESPRGSLLRRQSFVGAASRQRRGSAAPTSPTAQSTHQGQGPWWQSSQLERAEGAGGLRVQASQSGPSSWGADDAGGAQEGGPLIAVDCAYCFVLHPPPTVTSVTPRLVPSVGGTVLVVKGSRFMDTDDVRVRFRHAASGTDVVVVGRVSVALPSSSGPLQPCILCTAPACPIPVSASIVEVEVHVSLDGGKRFSGSPGSIAYYGHPRVISARPLLVFAAHAKRAVLTLHGAGFAATPDACVRFTLNESDGSWDERHFVRPTSVTPEEVRCLVPALAQPGLCVVEVTNDGDSFTACGVLLQVAAQPTVLQAFPEHVPSDISGAVQLRLAGAAGLPAPLAVVHEVHRPGKRRKREHLALASPVTVKTDIEYLALEGDTRAVAALPSALGVMLDMVDHALQLQLRTLREAAHGAVAAAEHDARARADGLRARLRSACDTAVVRFRVPAGPHQLSLSLTVAANPQQLASTSVLVHRFLPQAMSIHQATPQACAAGATHRLRVTGSQLVETGQLKLILLPVSSAAALISQCCAPQEAAARAAARPSSSLQRRQSDSCDPAPPRPLSAPRLDGSSGMQRATQRAAARATLPSADGLVQRASRPHSSCIPRPPTMRSRPSGRPSSSPGTRAQLDGSAGAAHHVPKPCSPPRPHLDSWASGKTGSGHSLVMSVSALPSDALQCAARFDADTGAIVCDDARVGSAGELLVALSAYPGHLALSNARIRVFAQPRLTHLTPTYLPGGWQGEVRVYGGGLMATPHTSVRLRLLRDDCDVALPQGFERAVAAWRRSTEAARAQASVPITRPIAAQVVGGVLCFRTPQWPTAAGVYAVEVALDGAHYVTCPLALVLYDAPVLLPNAIPHGRQHRLRLHGSLLRATCNGAVQVRFAWRDVEHFTVHLPGAVSEADGAVHVEVGETTFPAQAVGTPMAIAVSLDGGQSYYEHCPTFRLFHKPSLVRTAPEVGAAEGGCILHLHGTGLVDTGSAKVAFMSASLGEGQRAQLQEQHAAGARLEDALSPAMQHSFMVPAQFVSSTEVRCCTPALPRGTYEVFLSLNGEEYVHASPPAVFIAVPRPRSISLDPSFGMVASGATVTLTGHFLVGTARSRLFVAPDGGLPHELPADCAIDGDPEPAGAPLVPVSSLSAGHEAMSGTCEADCDLQRLLLAYEDMCASPSPEADPAEQPRRVALAQLARAVQELLLAVEQRSCSVSYVLPTQSQPCRLALWYSMDGQHCQRVSPSFQYIPVPQLLQSSHDSGPVMGGDQLSLVFRDLVDTRLIRVRFFMSPQLSESAEQSAAADGHSASTIWFEAPQVLVHAPDGHQAGASGTVGGGEAAGCSLALLITTPAVSSPGPARILLSLNGKDDLDIGLTYWFCPMPTVLELRPSAGSHAGGTQVALLGTDFSPRAKLFARFVADSGPTSAPAPVRVDDGGRAFITAPEFLPNTRARLVLCFNDVALGCSPMQTAVSFFYYESPYLFAVRPDDPPFTSVLRIQGDQFARVGGQPPVVRVLLLDGPRRGRVGGTRAAGTDSSRALLLPGHIESSSVITCQLPSDLPQLAMAAVEVSLNGCDYTTQGHTIQLLFPPTVSSIAPRWLPACGGVPVRLEGHNIVDTRQVKVRFTTPHTSAVAPASAGVGSATCAMPRVATQTDDAAMEGTVSICLDGGSRFGDASIPVHFYKSAAKVSAVHPMTGPMWGGTEIMVVGKGFFDTGDLVVRFRSLRRPAVVHDVPARYRDGSSITCITPRFEREGKSEVQVSARAVRRAAASVAWADVAVATAASGFTERGCCLWPDGPGGTVRGMATVVQAAEAGSHGAALDCDARRPSVELLHWPRPPHKRADSVAPSPSDSLPRGTPLPQCRSAQAASNAAVRPQHYHASQRRTHSGCLCLTTQQDCSSG